MSKALLRFAAASIISTTAVMAASKEACGADAPAHFEKILGLDATPVLFILRVHPGSPAEKAGLASCDLILSFAVGDEVYDLRRIHDAMRFSGQLREAAMLSSARLNVLKYDGPTESYIPDTTELRIAQRPGAADGLSWSFRVVIKGVMKDSVAERAGIKPWDFIERVNDDLVPNLRSVVPLDVLVSKAASGEGRIQLTVTRWQPVTIDGNEGTKGSSRKVVLNLSENRTPGK